MCDLHVAPHGSGSQALSHSPSNFLFSFSLLDIVNDSHEVTEEPKRSSLAAFHVYLLSISLFLTSVHLEIKIDHLALSHTGTKQRARLAPTQLMAEAGCDELGAAQSGRQERI